MNTKNAQNERKSQLTEACRRKLLLVVDFGINFNQNESGKEPPPRSGRGANG